MHFQNFKYNSPKPLKCVWTVQTSAGSKIQIKVEEIVPCEGEFVVNKISLITL